MKKILQFFNSKLKIRPIQSDVLVQQLCYGLMSSSGDAHWALFTKKVEKYLPAFFYVWKQVRKTRDFRALGPAVCCFFENTLDNDIVDREYPACRDGGVCKHSFSKVRLLRSLATVCAQGETSDVFLHRLVEHNKTNHVFLIAYAAELLLRNQYRAAADAALEARKLVTFDICCTRVVNDTQKALHESGLGSDLELPSGDHRERFCKLPFTLNHYTYSSLGPLTPATMVCICTTWLPLVFESDSSWNNKELQEVRRSILDGNYKYCDEFRCPSLKSGDLPKREEVTDPYLRDIIIRNITKLPKGPTDVCLGYDPTCNLSCPSCRNEIVRLDKDTSLALDTQMEKILLPLLPDIENLSLSCIGEALASRHFLHLLKAITPDRYPNLRITLLTNLALLTPAMWDRLGESADAIKTLQMSIDGGTPKTVEKLRRGLKWERMLAALSFSRELRLSGKIEHMMLNTVLQKETYGELKELLELASTYCIDTLRIAGLYPIGNLSPDEFAEINIHDSRHPLFKKCCFALDELEVSYQTMKKNTLAIESAGKTVPEIIWAM